MLAQKKLSGRGRFLYISQGSKSRFYSLAILERTLIVKKDRVTGGIIQERPFQSTNYLSNHDSLHEALLAFDEYKEY